MIVLDTNVVSELMKESPYSRVTEWLSSRDGREVYTTAITRAEIEHGIARLPEGRRKAGLEQAATRLFLDVFERRVLGFYGKAATWYGWIMAQRERLGRPLSVLDAQIAAICKAAATSLATRNTSDFERLGLTLSNPWGN